MAENWQINKRLAETNLYMFENGILGDVIFLVGSDRHEVKAHKYMLVSRSPVFYAMFCGTIAESRDKIEIPDIDLDGFKELLRFIYAENCDVTADTVMSLLYAGKKYDVGALVEKCTAYLKSEISTENVCVILQQAYMFDEQDLVQQCLSIVFKNGDKVLKSLAIASLKKDVLHLIIESDLLEAEEVNVYTACVKWAEVECRRTEKDVNDANVKEALGVDLIKLIRFPRMTLDEFAAHVARRAILTAEEKVDVFLQFTTKADENECLFSRKARKPALTITRVHLNRFNHPGIIQRGWGPNKVPDLIQFEFSENVSLVGVSLFTPCNLGTIAGTLKIQDNDKRCLMYIDIQLVFDGNIQFTDVMFEFPVQISKDTRYTMIQDSTGVQSYYGFSGNKRVTMQDVEVRFFRCIESKHTSDDFGQFRGFIFDVPKAV